MKKILLMLLLGTFQGLSAQSSETIFQSLIDSLYQAHPASVGIMVHVEAPGRDISWSGASGYADKEQKTPLQADQPILIASSIKTYVAAAILRLVEQEKLSIDQAIEGLLQKKTEKRLLREGYDLAAIQVKH